MNNEQIKFLLFDKIPLLRQTQMVWIADKKLYGVDPMFVKQITQTIPVELKRVHGEKWDCDDIAINGMMAIRKWWKNHHSGPEAVSFGVGYGFKWKGIDDNHTANVFIFGDRVYGYDFQLDEHWLITPQNDLIYKVDM
jgi:hypothetical protein